MGVLIGELAAAAGVSPSAVRYYEAQGLLPRAERVGGRRVYDRDDLKRLRVLSFARRVGFNVAQLRCLAAALPDLGVEGLADAVRSKLSQVDDLIAELQATREQLVLAETCECTSVGAPTCELISGRG